MKTVNGVLVLENATVLHEGTSYTPQGHRRYVIWAVPYGDHDGERAAFVGCTFEEEHRKVYGEQLGLVLTASAIDKLKGVPK